MRESFNRRCCTEYANTSIFTTACCTPCRRNTCRSVSQNQIRTHDLARWPTASVHPNQASLQSTVSQLSHPAKIRGSSALLRLCVVSAPHRRASSIGSTPCPDISAANPCSPHTPSTPSYIRSSRSPPTTNTPKPNLLEPGSDGCFPPGSSL